MEVIENFGPEITRLMTLSISHIRPETASKLDADAEDNRLGICIHKFNYGYYIVVDQQTVELAEQKDALPEDLKRIVLFAATMGCATVCLDCDGLECQFLPTYTWDE